MNYQKFDISSVALNLTNGTVYLLNRNIKSTQIFRFYSASYKLLTMKSEELNQTSDKLQKDFFDNPYYSTNKKLLLFVGQYPYQTTKSRIIASICLLVTVITLVIPQSYQLSHEVRDHNPDGAFECLPALLTNMLCFLKMGNLQINKKMVTKLLDMMKEEWQLMTDEIEWEILKKLTANGTSMCRLYRNIILMVFILYLILPLIPIMKDVIDPLNETRLRNHIFKVDYLVDPQKYFYPIYFHAAISSFYTVIMVITVDSIYMMINHHACSLFALCGHKIQQLTDQANIIDNDQKIYTEQIAYKKLQECVLSHKKALKFAAFMDESTSTTYLMQIGLTMVLISITAVQIVIKIHDEELLRYVAYVFAQCFHLFFISLPGQKLVDYSIQLSDTIYCTKWYTVSMRMQRLLLIIQSRCRIPCKMTAGGLYDMNIENFGMIVKTSISYFTLFSSLRE